MTKTEVGADSKAFVTLRFAGDDLDPQDISAVLPVEPTRAHRKGEEFFAGDHAGHLRGRTGIWFLATDKLVPSDDLADHLRFVADLLRPEPSDERLVNQLSDILQRTRSRAHITCFWYGDSGETIPEIPGWFKSAIKPLLADLDTDFVAGATVISDGWEEAQLEFVSSITAPLFWEFRDSTGKDRMNNGSLFFLDAGEGVFAVTAAHVVEACLRDSESPMFQCMIGGNGPGRIIYLQLRDRIINIHHGMDIATLRISRDEVDLADRNILTSPEGSWPPSLVEVGAVACCGCPGEGRWMLRRHEISFGFLPIGAFATSVHETCISIQIEREKFRPVFGKGIPENYDFGGMSGGPVLEILQTSNGQFWRRPVGVIFQGPNPSGKAAEAIQGLEIIRARPVHFINRDGTLDVTRWEQSNG